MNSRIRAVVAGLALVVAAGCATGSRIRSADAAGLRGDWDTAVAYYREALARDPNRVDVKVKLQRATRNASGEHLKRAKDLEAQDQLPGAIAEYRLAGALDPGNTLAATKASELERKIREQLEAARPRSRVDELRQQAAQQSGVPKLDPRTPIPFLRNAGSVRDLLRAISELTGIGVTYEQGSMGVVDRPFPFEIRNQSVEEALAQIMSANRLTYKVIGQNTIFVYADTPQLRQQYEDQYVQPFFLSHADAAEVAGTLNQLLSQGATGSRPQIQVNKNGNMLIIKGSLPVLTTIDNIIRTLDKPRAEVMIEAEILEVDRLFLKQVGLDLSQWALGFTYSPELAPTAGGLPPTPPPPINMNTLRQGTSVNDFYVTVPSALVQLLESDARTKVLAKPQIRGREGMTVNLGLGDEVPQPQTVFQASAAGGIANVPATQVQYRRIGVNLIFTPRVTYQGEIILENMTLEKSGLGANLEVGGQTFPTFVTRTAQTTIRLRDGESNLLAGLIRDESRRTATSFPGLTGLPILRNIFGNTQTQVDQTDVVMIITPRIVRGHELTVSDFKPQFVGVGQNFGSGAVPPLISPDAPPPAPVVPAGAAGQPGTPPPGVPPGTVSMGVPPGQTATPATTTATPPRAPGVVPIQPVTPAAEPAATPPSQGKVVVTAPTAALQVGAPYTVPISVEGISQQLGVLSLTVTYDPTVLRAVNVVQGTHMQQGGVTTTFAPKIDAATGRVDIAIARPFDRPGVTGPGVLGAVAFEAVRPGTSPISIQGVLTTTSGQPIPVQMVSGTVTVK
ncbi:MAG TPA: cohesin domain-containing protein [Vicinamibacterales bacterium]|nr:cohesin domain-containing protein [Vicinamibacterales bacterium]